MPTAEAAAKVEREKRGRRNYLPLDGYFGEWQHKYYSEPKPSIENHLFFFFQGKRDKISHKLPPIAFVTRYQDCEGDSSSPNQFLLGKVFHLLRCVGTTKNWLSIGSSVEIFYPTKGSQIHTFTQTIYWWCDLVENNSLKSGIDIEKKWGKSSCEYSQVIPFELNWKQYCLVFKIPVNFHFLCKKSCVCTA